MNDYENIMCDMMNDAGDAFHKCWIGVLAFCIVLITTILLSYKVAGSPLGMFSPLWTENIIPPHPIVYDWLCMTATNGSAQISMQFVGYTRPDIELEYSIDGGYNWQNMDIYRDVISISEGESVFFRAGGDGKNSEGLGISANSYYRFNIIGDGAVDLSGNIISLIDKNCVWTGEVPRYCFYSLFDGANVLSAESLLLPFERLSPYCYARMFANSTLKVPPMMLNAKVIDEYSYAQMFAASDLSETPQMSYPEIASGCYSGMFKDCMELGKTELIPQKLPAQILAPYCYEEMYDGCSYISTIRADFPSWDVYAGMTTNWVRGVSYNGSFYCSGSLGDNILMRRGESWCPEYWNVIPDSVALGNALCFTSQDPDPSHTTSVRLIKIGNAPQVELEYFVEGSGYWDRYFDDMEIELSPGKSVYFRATATGNLCFAYDGENRNSFQIQGYISASGQIDSLLSQDSIIYEYATTNVFHSLFCECRTLLSAPSFATPKLSEGCYESMFVNCVSLTEAPALPSMNLNVGCYRYMFEGCKNLVSYPPLPATNLYDSCYERMFKGCPNLISAGDIRAKTLSKNCCKLMFYECFSLTNAPKIKADTLAESCYEGMFWFCTSLSSAPELPVKELAKSCYKNMFHSCTSLIFTKPLKAKKLAPYCYSSMYENTKIQEVRVLADELNERSCEFMCHSCTNLKHVEISYCEPEAWTNQCYAWLSGVPQYGTFVCYEELGNTNTIARGVSHCPEDWDVSNNWLPIDKKPLPRPKYDALRFVALEGGCTISMASEHWGSSEAPIVFLETSLDGIVWSPFTVDTTIITLSEPRSEVYFRASSNNSNPTFAADAFNYNYFVITGKVAADGNIMSIVNDNRRDTLFAPYTFCNLFYDCNTLESAPIISATNTTESCFQDMFSYCTSLKTAPELPSEIISPNCYNQMFYGCTGLETPMKTLPGKVSSVGCYTGMFVNCTSLISSPLIEMSEPTNGLDSMFLGCTSLKDVEVRFVAWPPNGLNRWLELAGEDRADFHCPGVLGNAMTIERGDSYCPNDWHVSPND